MTTDHSPSRAHRFAVWFMVIGTLACAVAFSRPSALRRPVRIPDQIDVPQIGATVYTAPDAVARDRAIPVAAPISTASVTWFCGGAPAGDTQLILTNIAPSPRRVLVTAVNSRGDSKVKAVEVAARSASSLPMSFAGSGIVVATVESRHGGLVVSQRIVSASSATTASCSTSSSTSWFFAGGNTERGASEKLVLFNPFDDLATADVTFLTPDGFRRPQQSQGLAVEGRSAVVVDVNSVQNRRSGLGSAVTTRAGRLVVWRLQTFDGSGTKLAGGQPPKGESLTLGQSTPLTHFALPTAVSGAGVSPRIVLANPGASESKVQLSFAVDDSGTSSPPSETTVDLVSGQVVVLEGDSLRQVASGVPFSVRGRVVSGGAVVAELWFDGAEPAKGHGSFATASVPVAARRWVAPFGLASPPLDQVGILAGAQSANVQFWAVGDGKLDRLTGTALPARVPARGRVTVDLSALLEGRPGTTIMISSTAPVVVSRLQAGNTSAGLVSAVAVPVAGGFAEP